MKIRLTRAQAKEISFAALCLAAELEESHEAHMKEVKDAIKRLHKAQAKLDQKRGRK